MTYSLLRDTSTTLTGWRICWLFTNATPLRTTNLPLGLGWSQIFLPKQQIQVDKFCMSKKFELVRTYWVIVYLVISKLQVNFQSLLLKYYNIYLLSVLTYDMSAYCIQRVNLLIDQRKKQHIHQYWWYQYQITSDFSRLHLWPITHPSEASTEQFHCDHATWAARTTLASAHQVDPCQKSISHESNETSDEIARIASNMASKRCFAYRLDKWRK